MSRFLARKSSNGTAGRRYGGALVLTAAFCMTLSAGSARAGSEPPWLMAQAGVVDLTPPGAGYGTTTPGVGSSGTYMSSYGNYGEPQPTRSIFFALFLSNFVPGVAGKVSEWFNNAVFSKSDAAAAPDAKSQRPAELASARPVSVGSLTSDSADAPTRNVAAGSADTATAGDASDAGTARGVQPALYAGVAFEVLKINKDGKRVSVEANHSFASGERFEIVFRPNFPASVEVFNVDPVGRESLIDRQQLSATQLERLGPYEFTGAKGEEGLRIVMTPCKVATSIAMRGIIKAELRPEVASRLQSCETATGKDAPATRSIVKVVREGDTSFALDPITKTEMDSSKIAARDHVFKLIHD